MTSTLDTPTSSPTPGPDGLEPVVRLLDDRGCTVLSLDVFDTVLWRRVPRPTDVFPLLAVDLRAGGHCPEWITDATFRRMRIDAERRARAACTDGDEISLTEIWRRMPRAVFPHEAAADLAARELAAERRLTVVDPAVARLARTARARDVTVVLVSDTYFGEAQLRHLLDRPELDGLRDARIFRSQQYGVAKSTGLWDVVLHELGVRPEQILHVGDDERADHTVPAEAGIRTVHYRRIDPDFARVLERERESVDSFGRYGPTLDPDRGDHGLTTLRARSVAGSPHPRGSSQDTAWRYGAAVLGPVLTGFAEWTVRRAVEAGARTVWCPMREGEQLAQLVDAAAQAHGLPVAARPIWLSRQATLLASLDPSDTDALPGFLRRGYGVRVRDALDLLGLRPGDVPCLAAHLDTCLDHDDVAARVASALTETPHLRHRLSRAARDARARLVAALRMAGALDDPDLVLVDLGWGGTIQLQLARALEIHGTPVRPTGLYLATDERSVRVVEHGLRADGFLGQAGHPRELVDLLTRSPEVLEQCVSATCGSLLDYTVDGEPILGEPSGPPSQDAERTAAQQGTRAFQELWNTHVRAGGPEWGDLAGTARTRLATIIGTALSSPTAEEAALFGGWRHEDNLGSRLVTTLLPDDLLRAVPYLSPNDLAELNMRDAFWPALVGASDPSLAAAAAALGDGRIRPAAFESPEEASYSGLRLRTDDGWREGPSSPVRINPSGLSFARLRCVEPGTVEAALAVPGRPAIVRIDWIEAVLTGPGPEPVTLRWDGPSDLAGLAVSGCTWLGGSMIEFRGPESALVLPLAGLAGGPVTTVQVSVAFAMLPQSRTQLSRPLPGAGRTARLVGRVRAERRMSGTRGVLAGAGRLAGRMLGRRA